MNFVGKRFAPSKGKQNLFAVEFLPNSGNFFAKDFKKCNI